MHKLSCKVNFHDCWQFWPSFDYFLRIVASVYDKKKNFRKTWFFVSFFTPVQVIIFRRKKLTNSHKFDNNWLWCFFLIKILNFQFEFYNFFITLTSANKCHFTHLEFKIVIFFKIIFKLFKLFSRSPLILVKFTQLNRDLCSILGSFGQFLLSKIKFQTFSICNVHFPRLVSILAKVKIKKFFQFVIQQCLEIFGQKNF
jgi:hypothetical protein